MYRFDYHLHTLHSPDGEMTMDQLAEAAIAAGLDEICVTDHTDIGHPDVDIDRPLDIAQYFADIEAAREKFPQLAIRAGLEVGDNPARRDEIRAWHDALQLDFRLLSLHLIDGQDPYFQKFYETGTQEEQYRRYLEMRLESLLYWPPEWYDSIAHLGYVAKFAPYPIEVRPLRLHHGADLLDAILRRLADSGKALELNTSGYRKVDDCMPGREILTRFRELGGEFVTIGSDAHKACFVGNWVDDARALALSCGIRYALTFEKRKPIPIAL